MTNHGADMLARAADTIRERQKVYGPPTKNFEVIADRWNAHLKGRGYRLVDATGATVVLDSSDTAAMSIDVKMARLANDMTHDDSWVDIAGYAGCGYAVTRKAEDDCAGMSAPREDGWVTCGMGDVPDDLDEGDQIILDANVDSTHAPITITQVIRDRHSGRALAYNGWLTSIVAYRRVASAPK